MQELVYHGDVKLAYVSKSSLDGLPQAEYVYLIRDVEVTGYYKIGKTKRPKARIVDEFGVKLPFEVEVLRMMPTQNATVLEQILHRKYEHRRKNGEWFDLLESDVLEIMSMGSGLESRSSDSSLYSVFQEKFGILPLYNVRSALDKHNTIVIKPLDGPAEIHWSQGLSFWLSRMSPLSAFVKDLPSSISAAYVMAQMLLSSIELAKSLNKEKGKYHENRFSG